LLALCRCCGVTGWFLTAWLFVRNSSVDELLYEHSHSFYEK
jgi:hypothetical protein